MGSEMHILITNVLNINTKLRLNLSSKFFFVSDNLANIKWFIDAHRERRGGRGAPHVPLLKIFEKLPHKNAIKHDPPWFFHNSMYPSQKNLPKKPKDPPSWISKYCASMKWLNKSLIVWFQSNDWTNLLSFDCKTL